MDCIRVIRVVILFRNLRGARRAILQVYLF